MVDVPLSKGGCSGFESLMAHHFKQVLPLWRYWQYALVLEASTPEGVVSSNLTRGTKQHGDVLRREDILGVSSLDNHVPTLY